MKNLIYFLSLFLFSSCQDFVCKENQTDLANEWTAIPTETIRFVPSIERNIVEFKISEIVSLGLNDCYADYETRSIFGQDTITNTYLRGINYEIIATEKDVKIYYSFLPAEPVFTGIPSPDIQKIGCFSLLQNTNCENEINQIGEITINGIPYMEVFQLTENKSHPNPTDVKQILINKKGILQIEFYDGEMWSRIF